MNRSTTGLLFALACVVAIGGSPPQATAQQPVAQQARVVAATGNLDSVQNGWVAWTPHWSSKTGSMTWWSSDEHVTFADQLAASGIMVTTQDPDASVFLLQLEQGRVTRAYVTRMDSGIQVKGGSVRWFVDVTQSESASFLRSAWESGGESTLLYMLGHHPDAPGVEAFLTQTAEGNADLEDRKSALYGLGALGTASARRTLLAFIRSTRGA